MEFHLIYEVENTFFFFADIGDIRLGGSCRGDLEVYRNGLLYGLRFYDVCDSNFGDEEAAVVCRQLGCNPVGARRRDGR